MWRVALPAGSGRLVLYDGDTPLQVLVLSIVIDSQMTPNLIDAKAYDVELVQHEVLIKFVL